MRRKSRFDSAQRPDRFNDLEVIELGRDDKLNKLVDTELRSSKRNSLKKTAQGFP